MNTDSTCPHRIVIVGGGAAGLELATKLGDTLGRRGAAQITLIEKARTQYQPHHLANAVAKAMPMRLREVVDA